MAIDVSGPQVPGWWFRRLAHELVIRAPGYELLDRYYTGEIMVPSATGKATRDAYRRLMALARTNYSELVVEAVRERMQPLGFRTGGSDDPLGDEDAWRIWQANSLDADSGIAHRAGLSMGRMYVMVGGVDPDTEVPVITIEDPREVVTEQHPVKRRQSVAALKVFRDEWYGAERAYLHVGGRVYRYARPLPTIADGVESRSVPISDMEDGGWEEDSWDPLPYGIVPVVEFTNRTKTNSEPYGEFETHIGLLDRINYGVLNRLEIMTLQAFKQRAIKGIPRLDDAGNEIDYSDIFAADPGAMWQLPDTAEIWESEQVDLGPLRMANRDDVQDLAAVTRTPLFYLTPDAANGSAEGASLAREGLVFKTKDRLGQYGESWEQVMALAFIMMGDTTRGNRVDMEVIWRNPEHFSMAERFDAASKANAAGVPWSMVMSDILDYSPQEIERMKKERDKEAANSRPIAPPPVAPIAELAAAPNP